MATLTDKQAQLLLDKNFGSLAVLNEDGSPTVTPVWVDWDGEYVLVNTLRARAKPGRDERLPSVREHDDVTLLTVRRRVLEESESPIGPQTYRNAHPLTKRSDAQKGRGKPLPAPSGHRPPYP